MVQYDDIPEDLNFLEYAKNLTSEMEKRLLKLVNDNPKVIHPNFNKLSRIKARRSKKTMAEIFAQYSYMTLYEIKIAIKANDSKKTLASFINFQDLMAAVYFELNQPNQEELLKIAKSFYGKKNAAKRLENDPKQHALKQIESEFRESNYPFHKRGYKAKFAKEMWGKYPVIESISTINNLVSRLYKETLVN